MYKLSNKNQFDFDFFSDIVKSSNYRCVIKMFDMDKAIINFGKRIQEARILRNITQDQLAEKCGVTSKHISAVERGTSAGSVILLLNICSYLQINPNTLFIDSINFDSKSDNVIPIEHETLIKYAKLSKTNQKFIDN